MEYSREKQDYIITQYLEGKSQKDIATKLGTYNTTIRRILMRNNITLRTGSEAQSTVKSNPFKDLSDNETQYWLGYLAGDGNISKLPRLRINISSNRDPEHLLKYIAFIKYPVKLSQYFNKKAKCYEYSVNFQNRETYNFLLSLGITPNKSLSLELKIPLSYPLLLGYIDANGCIEKKSESYSSISISTGSIKLANQIKTFLNKDNIQCLIRTSTNNRLNPLYTVFIGKTKDMKILIPKLYNNASVYLERKRQNIGSAFWETECLASP